MIGRRPQSGSHPYLVLASVVLGLCVGANAAEPWTSFRCNMQHTGYTSRTSHLSPVLNWSERTSGSICGSPVMDTSGTLYVASGSGHVYAYSRAGVRLWAFDTGGTIFGSPVLGPDSTVYVGNLNGRIYGINPDGSQRWTYPIAAGGRDARILQSPGVGGDGRVYVCSWDSDLYCFTAGGTHVWNVDFGSGVLLSASPAVDSAGTVYVVGYRHDDGDNLRVRAYNPDRSIKWTRENRDMGSWSYTADTYIKSSVCVDEAHGRLYVGANCPTGGYLYCLNLADGAEVRWKQFGSAIYSAPSVGPDGTTYFGALDGRLYAYDPVTDVVKWSFQTDGLFILGSPLVDGDGNVYVGATDGCLYKIAPGGVEVWRFQTNSDVRSTPVIDENGVLYFGSMDSRLYSLGGPSAVAHWRWY